MRISNFSHELGVVSGQLCRSSTHALYRVFLPSHNTSLSSYAYTATAKKQDTPTGHVAKTLVEAYASRVWSRMCCYPWSLSIRGCEMASIEARRGTEAGEAVLTLVERPLRQLHNLQKLINNDFTAMQRRFLPRVVLVSTHGPSTRHFLCLILRSSVEGLFQTKQIYLFNVDLTIHT